MYMDEYIKDSKSLQRITSTLQGIYELLMGHIRDRRMAEEIDYTTSPEGLISVVDIEFLNEETSD